ncbi:MAG: hypothetical protein WC505_00200 [Patescibacteria group bacterium]
MIENNLQYLVKLSEDIKNSGRNHRIIVTLLYFFLTAILASGLFYLENKLHLAVINEITEYVPESLVYFLFILLSFFLILGFQAAGELAASYKRFGTYEWDATRVVKDWKFQGILRSDDDKRALVLTDSDAGCVLSRRSWKNFKLAFAFRVSNERGFGIIFRARDLENYLMFKVNPGQQARFHYRESGSWQILRGVGQPIHFPIGTWLNGSLEVKGQHVNLKIGDAALAYLIPNVAILNHIVETQKTNNPLTIPVAHKRGSVGFRAAGDEELSFKAVTVWRLP